MQANVCQSKYFLGCSCTKLFVHRLNHVGDNCALIKTQNTMKQQCLIRVQDLFILWCWNITFQARQPTPNYRLPTGESDIQPLFQLEDTSSDFAKFNLGFSLWNKQTLKNKQEPQNVMKKNVFSIWNKQHKPWVQFSHFTEPQAILTSQYIAKWTSVRQDTDIKPNKIIFRLQSVGWYMIIKRKISFIMPCSCFSFKYFYFFRCFSYSKIYQRWAVSTNTFFKDLRGNRKVLFAQRRLAMPRSSIYRP